MRIATPLLGGAGALLLHATLLTPILFGWGQAKRTDPQSKSWLSNTRGSDLTVVFIDQKQTRSEGAYTSPVTVNVAPLRELFLQLPKLPEVSRQDADLDEEVLDASDETQAMLRGRYVNQITARIERAWLRPRATLADTEVFDCRVWVTQDRSGQVLDIAPDRCNRDTRWRASLLLAIRSASPLPAPPDPQVFTRRVRLSFRSATYSPGGSTEGFEREPASPASAAGTVSPASASDEFDTMLSQLRARSPKTGVIDLRITGTPAPSPTASGNPAREPPPTPSPSDPDGQ